MRITIWQKDLDWADPARNRERMDRDLDTLPPTDLLVLPEMFSTGFCTQPQGIAETQGETLDWMRRTAAQRECAVAGSVAVEEAGRYYNRFYFVTPSGEVTRYDKHHLFSYGGEHLHFTPGAERVVVSHKGWRLLLAVCYDLRFPVWLRNRGDYDAALFVANWPVPRIEVWNTLLRARAIENQCYVVGVNRVGSDPTCQYSGGSAVIDPRGCTIAQCPWNEEAAVTAELGMPALTRFREKFPAQNDADNFRLLP